jgi:hypothetical protein
MLVVLVAVGWVSGTIFAAWQSRRYEGRKRWLTATGYVLLAIGGFAFFGILLGAVGALGWLPATFEWPIGKARNILIMADGKRVAANEAVDRIQIYDQNWKFLRGWFVNAYGGATKMGIKDGDKIEVLTARGNTRYVYDLNGSLLLKETYPRDQFGEFVVSRQHARVPTHWWSWPFANPVYFPIFVVLGVASLYAADPQRLQIRFFTDPSP